MTMDLHIHVPTPGELISPKSGSALVTISRSLGAAQIRAGGRAAFLARSALSHDPEPMELIEAEMPNKVWLTPSEKVRDLIAGHLVKRWPATEKLWNPLYSAIPHHHKGPVFLHNAPAAATGMWQVRPEAIGVVYLHNEVFRGWTPQLRRALARAHPLVFDSRFLRDRFLHRFHRLPEPLVLLNGTDLELFYPAREEPEPTVLFVGKVAPHKGPDLLIRAVQMLFNEGHRFKVLIVGSSVLSATAHLSDFEENIRAQASGLGNYISFLPFVDRNQIAEVYRAATIFVVPSNWDEPCSLTLPEAMASGLACIASRRGGLPEVGGDAALYFDPPDISQLASKLRLLLMNDDDRRARAVEARRRAERISWERQLSLLIDWVRNRPTR